MKSCDEIKKKLILLAGDVLNDKQKKAITSHIPVCSKCNNEFQKIKNIIHKINTPEQHHAPDHFSSIIEKAETEIAQGNILNKITSLISNRTKKMQIAFTLASISLVVLFTLLIPAKYNKLYIVKASGSVLVNQESFYNTRQIKYSLNQNIAFNVKQGMCAFQIASSKMILLQKDTQIQVKKQKGIFINLIKGLLQGKVLKNKSKDKLIILAGKAQFEIIGTMFEIKKDDQYVNLIVKQGTVKAIINSKTNFINKGKRLKINDNGELKIAQIPINNNRFLEITKLTVHKELNHMRGLFINTDKKADIFWQNRIIGQTPLFIWDKKNLYDHIYIKAKKHHTQKINLLRDKEIDLKLDLLPRKKFSNLWKRKLNAPVYSSLYLIDQSVICRDRLGITYKINKQNGSLIWKFYPNTRTSAQPYYHDGKIFLSYNNDILYALNFNSGKIIWKKEIGSLVYSTPKQYNNRLYACNNEGILFCLNVDNGSVIWHKKLDKGCFSSFSIEKEKLYIGGFSGKIYSFDLKNRDINWTYTTKARIVDSKPLIHNNIILIGSNDEHLYAIDKHKGKLLWKYKTDGSIFSSPVALDETVMITTINGTVYSLNINTGKLLWTLRPNQDNLVSSIAIQNDIIYVGINNKIVALNKWGLILNKYPLSATSFIISHTNQIILSTQNGEIINRKHF